MQKEKIRWITVKGTHIPIKEGQTAKEATATFFARQNASYAEIVKGTSQREQKKSDLTSNDGNGTITGEGLFRKKSNKRASHRIVISEKRFDELTVEARIKVVKMNRKYHAAMHGVFLLTAYKRNKK